MAALYFGGSGSSIRVDRRGGRVVRNSSFEYPGKPSGSAVGAELPDARPSLRCAVRPDPKC